MQLGKESLFIVTIGRIIQTHAMGRMQSFGMLKQVVHIEPVGFKGLIKPFSLLLWVI
jgi:hypothetical protein